MDLHRLADDRPPTDSDRLQVLMENVTRAQTRLRLARLALQDALKTVDAERLRRGTEAAKVAAPSPTI